MQKIENNIEEICRRRGIGFKYERLNIDAPAICDPTLVNTLLAASKELALPAKRLISRAYHDALFMAQICPTSMIFIPCRDGVSHRPDEYSSPEQIAAGVQVLARSLAKLAE